MTTPKDIEAVIWAACDVLRGAIDAAQYKDYILTLLFIKFVSDTHLEQRDTFLEKYGGDEQRADYALQRAARFQVPEVSSFDYLYENRRGVRIGNEEKGIGELIDQGLEELQAANPGKLSSPDGGSIFQNISFNSSNLGNPKNKHARLAQLLEAFNDKRLNLRPSALQGQDVIGNAYQYLIKMFASEAGKKAGEFYTPEMVSELVARLAKPKAGDRICDPTAGSASLLIRAAKQIPPDEHGRRNVSIYGQEAMGSTWALAIMNAFLNGFDDAEIRWGDTLRNPKLLEDGSLRRFDVVVANPPFSLKNWGFEEMEEDVWNRLTWGVPTKSKGDWAFIQHMLSTAKEGSGRVSVVVPHGVLFRGASEGRIRRGVIEDHLLDAVIGLPANLFYGTGIPAAILVFDRAREEVRKEDILFIDASAHFTTGKNQNALSEADLQRVTAVYDDFTKDKLKPGVAIEKFAYVATPAEIAENDFNLNIPRYVDTFEPEEPVDMQAVNQRILATKVELEKVHEEMKEILAKLGLA